MLQANMQAIITFALVLAVGSVTSEPDWRTLKHDPGYCALYGICGARKDGGALSCSNNTRAPPPTSRLAQALQKTCPTLWSETGGEQGRYCCTSDQVDKIATDTAAALPFIIGCPACHHNFIHFWCVMTCSPNQATWVNVTAVQKAPSNNATAVLEVDNWISHEFGTQLFDSCKNVKFGAANLPAMKFIGGGAENYQQWLDFMGLVKDKRVPPVGSPFQQNFPPADAAPPEITPLASPLPTCGDPAFRCSCADCPPAPSCSVAPDGPPPGDGICRAGRMRCSDLALLLIYLAVVASVLGAMLARRRLRSISATSLFGWGRRGDVLDGQPLVVGAAVVQREPLYNGSPMMSLMDEDEGAAEGGPAAGGAEEEDVHYPPVERALQRAFYSLGSVCVRNTRTVVLAAALLVLFCCLGFASFRVETDPQKLWVGPTSQAARDKAAFESSFGPFYRVEQLILSTTPTTPGPNGRAHGGPRPILSDATIELLFDMQDAIDALSAGYVDEAGARRTATLQDICYKPFGDACATQSVLQYWQMSRRQYEAERDKKGWGVKHTAEYCLSHWYTECRSAFEAPIDPKVVLGGFPTGSAFRNFTADATSYVITYPVASSPDNRAAALAWEAAFVKLARTNLTAMARSAHLSLAFSSERSVQDELSRESSSDAATVAWSYGAMLAYIAVALAALPSAPRARDLLVASRTSLGLAGVLIVAASVLCALGVASMLGVWGTLIIMEVIPFLVLAVGVDNMFVMAFALQRQDPSRPMHERAGEALAQAGPSITLAATCETLAFALGALTPMPAVRNFSICAALAVFFDFVFQVTLFMVLLAADTQRLEERRADCCPCLVFPAEDPPDWDAVGSSSDINLGPYEPVPPAQGDVSPSLRVASFRGDVRPPGGAGDGGELSLQWLLQGFVERVHAPLLARRGVQVGVLLLFFTGLCASLAAIPRLSVGLDQAVALPRDSYLQPYFKQVMGQLRVGPPLYIVVENLNVARGSPDINKVCSVSGCDPNSLLSQVAEAAANPQVSYVATPAASWLDDFLSWLNPALPACCRQHTQTGGGQCPPPDQPPCSTNATSCADCDVCFSYLPEGRPTTEATEKLLPWFLHSKPSAACAKGGAGVYSDNIQMDPNDPTGIAGLSNGRVAASAFRTYHTPLAHQHDFIGALRAARDLAARLSSTLGLRVYPYSIFHVFFEQYLAIPSTAALLLATPGAAVFAVCWLLTGSLWAAALLLLVLASLLVHLAGAMYLADMQVNAVSLVNLAMALGIAVEFTAHVTHAFCIAPGSRRQRAETALRQMAAPVLSGITLTKFVGVVVLAFARTQIFEVYYFRLYLALVILGALHGLVLLPVLLALVGPPSWAPSPQRRLFKLVATPRDTVEATSQQGSGASATSALGELLLPPGGPRQPSLH